MSRGRVPGAGNTDRAKPPSWASTSVTTAMQESADPCFSCFCHRSAHWTKICAGWIQSPRSRNPKTGNSGHWTYIRTFPDALCTAHLLARWPQRLTCLCPGRASWEGHYLQDAQCISRQLPPMSGHTLAGPGN